MTVTRFGACAGTIARIIEDSTGGAHRKVEQELPFTLPPISPGITRTVTVPYNSAWGPASYHVIACYQCRGISLTNIFPVCVRRDPLPFTIVPPDRKE